MDPLAHLVHQSLPEIRKSAICRYIFCTWNDWRRIPRFVGPCRSSTLTNFHLHRIHLHSYPQLICWCTCHMETPPRLIQALNPLILYLHLLLRQMLLLSWDFSLSSFNQWFWFLLRSSHFSSLSSLLALSLTDQFRYHVLTSSFEFSLVEWDPLPVASW